MSNIWACNGYDNGVFSSYTESPSFGANKTQTLKKQRGNNSADGDKTNLREQRGRKQKPRKGKVEKCHLLLRLQSVTALRSCPYTQSYHLMRNLLSSTKCITFTSVQIFSTNTSVPDFPLGWNPLCVLEYHLFIFIFNFNHALDSP